MVIRYPLNIALEVFKWLQTSKNSSKDGQKAAAAAGLGLAVLAGLSRVSNLATSVEFVEKIPLLLKVNISRPSSIPALLLTVCDLTFQLL